MGEWREIKELTRLRVLLFVREPEALFWVLVFPLVLAGVLGFAFRRGRITESRVLVAPGPGAQELVARLAEVEHLRVELVPDEAVRARELRRTNADALVEPGTPPRFLYDPSRAEAEIARLRVLAGLGDSEASRAEALAIEALDARGSRYVDFLFPGLLGMNLMGTGLWSIGFAIAEARQRKVLRRMLVTPMRRSSYLLSFFLSRSVFLILEVAMLATFGVLALGVPMAGSLILFASLCLLGAFAFAGLGILLASRARTIQGVSGLLNLAMMPMWLCSGVFFSYERFPASVQPLMKALPLTSLNDALRAVMLDGAGIGEVLPHMLLQTVWGVVAFLIALWIFRWE